MKEYEEFWKGRVGKDFKLPDMLAVVAKDDVSALKKVINEKGVTPDKLHCVAPERYEVILK